MPSNSKQLFSGQEALFCETLKNGSSLTAFFPLSFSPCIYEVIIGSGTKPLNICSGFLEGKPHTELHIEGTDRKCPIDSSIVK